MGFFSGSAGFGADICKGCAGAPLHTGTGEANPCRCAPLSLSCKNPIFLLAVPYAAEGKEWESGWQMMAKNGWLVRWKAFNITCIMGIFSAWGRRREKMTIIQLTLCYLPESELATQCGELRTVNTANVCQFFCEPVSKMKNFINHPPLILLTNGNYWFNLIWMKDTVNFIVDCGKSLNHSSSG